MATWNSSVPSYATISSTGLATGVAAGVTDITATLNSITSNTATLTVNVPVTADLTTPTASSTGVSISTPIVITFSGAVQPSTVTTSSFKVGTTAGGSEIAGNIVMSSGDTVATYTPTANLPFSTPIYVNTTSSILSAGGDPIAPISATFTTQPGYLIYQLSNTLASTGNLGGVTGADALCQSDSQCPTGATCHAMLAGTDGSYTREASPTPTNWVLQASTPYYNTSNQIIGTTTADAIFPFPLDNPINSIRTRVWTGLLDDWTTAPSNCTNWTVDGSAPQGYIGWSDSLIFLVIHVANEGCNEQNPFYCVQQP